MKKVLINILTLARTYGYVEPQKESCEDTVKQKGLLPYLFSDS